MMWLKRLMTWLCPPKASVRQQLREWMRRQTRKSPIECAMPPMLYSAILDEFEASHRTIFHVGLRLDRATGVWFDGMVVYPDPAVTEFTAR